MHCILKPIHLTKKLSDSSISLRKSSISHQTMDEMIKRRKEKRKSGNNIETMRRERAIDVFLTGFNEIYVESI